MVAKNRKLVVAFLVIALLVQTAIASANYDLGYERLVEDWRSCNFQLKEIEFNLADATRTYEQAKKDVKLASLSWSYLVDILNSLGKEISPIMKFSTVMRRSVRLEKAHRQCDYQGLLALAMQDGEFIRLRERYEKYWRLVTQLQISEKRVELAQLIKTKNSLLYEQGKLGKIDFKKSEIAYLEAVQKMLEDEMLLNESRQLLNVYVGVDLDTCYEISVWESQKNLDFSTADRYVDKAKKERLGIKLIYDQIEINQLTIETYEKYFEYSSLNEDLKDSYDSVKENIKSLELQLKKKLVSVEKEIMELFLDLNYERYKIKTLLNIRNNANSNLLKIKELYAAGEANNMELLEAEIEYEEAKDAYLRSIFNYNTQVYKLNCLSGVGLKVENTLGKK